MKYQKFLGEIERELELRMLGKGETPILDRLQIHIDNLNNKDYGLDTLLNPNNIKHELYVSMLYQIVYPAKKKRKLELLLKGCEVEGSTMRLKMQNLLKIVGFQNILSLPNYNKYLYKSSSINKDLSIYKEIDDTYSFDVTMGDSNIADNMKNFCAELKNILNFDIEFNIKITY